MTSTNVWVDDRDPRVRFNGVWPLGGSPREYKETVSSSTRVGDSFVVPFYGKSIVVFGTIDATSGGVVANYSIDGEAAVQVTSMAGPGDTLHQQFWMSPVLNITQHELTVTMARVNPDAEPGEGTIWFDYFIVNDPSGHEGVPPKKGLSKGGIVGAALGGVVLLVATIVCLILWIRRRKRRQEEFEVYDKELGGDGVSRRKYVEDRDRDGDGMVLPSNLVGRQRTSRGGVRPFLLGFSTSQAPSSRESDLPLTRGSSKKGGSGTTGKGTQQSRLDSESTSDHVASPSTSSTASSSRLSQTPHPQSSSADNALPTILEVRPSKRNRSLREVTPSSSSTGDNDVPAAAAPTAQADVSECRPVITIATVAETSDIERLDGGDQPQTAASVQVTAVQHVDSGVRLGVAPHLPAELPPVYSPT